MSLEQDWEAQLRYGWLPVTFQGIWTLVLSWFCCLDRGFSVLYLHSPWSAGTPGKPTISSRKKKMTAELLFMWWTHETFDHGCQKNSEPYQPLLSNLGGRIGLSPELESAICPFSWLIVSKLWWQFLFSGVIEGRENVFAYFFVSVCTAKQR